MSASNVAWGPGTWLVYGVVLGPAAAPPESIGPRLTPGSHVSDSSTSHNGSSLIRAVESSSVRQLLNQMSLDEKRALVEAMLGVSLDWLMEGRATAETASGPAPASMRPTHGDERVPGWRPQSARAGSSPPRCSGAEQSRDCRKPGCLGADRRGTRHPPPDQVAAPLTSPDCSLGITERRAAG